MCELVDDDVAVAVDDAVAVDVDEEEPVTVSDDVIELVDDDVAVAVDDAVAVDVDEEDDVAVSVDVIELVEDEVDEGVPVAVDVAVDDVDGIGRTIFLMTLFPVSATSAMTPAASSVTPRGWLNVAVARPSVLPRTSGEPASVVTTPVGMSMRRTRWLYSSATSAIDPAALSATPMG